MSLYLKSKLEMGIQVQVQMIPQDGITDEFTGDVLVSFFIHHDQLLSHSVMYNIETWLQNICSAGKFPYGKHYFMPSK